MKMGKIAKDVYVLVKVYLLLKLIADTYFPDKGVVND